MIRTFDFRFLWKNFKLVRSEKNYNVYDELSFRRVITFDIYGLWCMMMLLAIGERWCSELSAGFDCWMD